MSLMTSLRAARAANARTAAFLVVAATIALAGLALSTTSSVAQAKDTAAPSTPKHLTANENGAAKPKGAKRGCAVRKHGKHARKHHRHAGRHHKHARKHHKHAGKRHHKRAAHCKRAHRAQSDNGLAHRHDRTAPTAPANLTAAGGAQQVALAWSESTDNVGVAGYDVYSSGAKIGSAATAADTIAGLPCGTTYQFTVDAYDSANNHSPQSSPVSVATTACTDGSAPSSPGGLQGSNISGTGLNLAWSPSTDNVGVKGYDVFKGGTAIAQTSATNATVSGLSCASTYSFAVDAFDAAGNHSAKSAPLSVTTSQCSSTGSPAPGSQSIYWGAWMGGNTFGSGYGDAPWDDNTWSRFESDAGKKASIVHFGNAWQSGGSFMSFPQSMLDKVRLRGSIPMLDWATWNLGASDQSAFQLSKITRGDFDSYIRSWATAAKNWGHPFFLRFDHEMNGKWFPWGEGTNGNTSGQFAAMWRHVHDIFTSVGATNVTWVWCPNTVWSGSTPLSGLYPGDSYVDWTGIDGYNWASVKGTSWQSFGTVISPTYNQISSLAPTKPIAIGETGSIESGGSKASWMSDMLKVLPTSFPKIKALVYFNRTADGANWPIESSGSATSAFAGGIASSYYAPGGSFANLPLMTKIDPM
jgi:chitodextrinase